MKERMQNSGNGGMTAVSDQSGAQPTLLSRQQLAQRWGCCKHSIARRHDLEPVRLSRRMLRYKLSDIEAIESAAAK
jgi:hypothetical protein